MSVDAIVAVYLRMLHTALPIAAVFGISNLAVDTVLTAAFGGGFKLRGVRR